ncbi:hypothetical protein [Streptomyces formicae]
MIHVFNPAKGNKWLYLEMIREQRTEGDVALGRNGMEYVLGIMAHLNNASGKTFVSDSTIAKQAGYKGNSHGFKDVRKEMKDAGYLHVWGKKGRAFEVSLLVPERLHEEYEELSMTCRKVQIGTGPSHIRELTHNSEPGTHDPGLGTQNVSTPDPEGQDAETVIDQSDWSTEPLQEIQSPAPELAQEIDSSSGHLQKWPVNIGSVSPQGDLFSSVGSDDSYSSSSTSGQCACGSGHLPVAKPRIRVAGELRHDVFVCPDIAPFGGVGKDSAHLIYERNSR